MAALREAEARREVEAQERENLAHREAEARRDAEVREREAVARREADEERDRAARLADEAHREQVARRRAEEQRAEAERRAADAQRELVHGYLRPVLPDAGGLHILELACGTGEDALWFARRGCAVTATDASSAMLGVAGARLASAGFASAGIC